MELYSSRQASRLAGITYRQLDDWTRSGLMKPEQEATGSGSARRWSSTQVMELQVIGELRRAGLSMQKIRRAVNWLRRNLANVSAPLAELSFVTDGQRIFYLSPNPGKLVDVLAGGQAVLTVAVGEAAQRMHMNSAMRRSGRRVQYDLPHRVRVGEDGFFIADCPVLRGCATQGRTRREAEKNLAEVMEDYLSVLEDMATEEVTGR